MGNTKNYQFLHSTYRKEGKHDYITAVLKDVDTGVSELATFKDPKRTVYLLNKAKWKDVKYNLEFARICDVTPVEVSNVNMQHDICRRLGQRVKYGYGNNIINDPRVFGAGTPIEVLIKQHFLKKCDRTSGNIRVGSLDIETSVIGGQEIILNTYVTHDHKVYTAILASFLKGHTVEHVQALTDKLLKAFYEDLNPRAQQVYDANPPVIEFKVCQTEAEVITWIMDNVHREKDDYVGIWNIDYDIPYIIKRIDAVGLNLYDVMCHPAVPREHRVCTYHQDQNKNAQHPTHKWHYFELSGYSQFICLQNLYSRLRKVKGVRTSYALNVVTNNTMGTGKLDFGSAGHNVMQTERFDEYCAYNVVDALLVAMQDKILQDVDTMLLLTRTSDIKYFAKETKKLEHAWNAHCKDNNTVPGCCAGSQARAWDHLIKNTGGAVMTPDLALDIGVRKLKESNRRTAITLGAGDVDVTSEYPNLVVTANISRQTKLGTVLAIEGRPTEDVFDFFSHVITPIENSVYLGSEYFGLPDYTEMCNMFTEQRAIV